METQTPKLNYIPGSMSFADGFMGPKSNVGYFMKFDMSKVKEIIESLIKSGAEVEEAEAGLDGDWDINSCTVYSSGDFYDYNVHDNSCWAEPIMIVTFKNRPSETYSVWKKVD